MPRGSYNDLLAFIAVARERSFTRAAAQLGVSQAALSYTIRTMETRMGVRLLTRTTRSVSPTEAGERLLQSIVPHFQEIEAELMAVGELRDKPAGTLRITASENAAETVLWPRLAKLLPKHPLINVEVTVESRFVDIVAERYDMGIRLGDELARDMTAVRISPDMRVAIVGSPGYLAKHPAPRKPQDLADHVCINLRLMSHGDLYAWELKKGKQQVNVRVEGRLVFNGTRPILHAALAGFGLGYLPEDMAQPYIAKGRLERVLEDWSPAFPGYHLYYPSRRYPSRAMAVLIEALRYPAKRR
ncbi:Transcriptional regulator LysR family protein [Azotobacter vinelandii CA]|uniref:Transcriptional regulator LysR family protein n=2 Tax=Azotobacter vinelandii TaxID=354 RepID=C1DP54_AZOVD|nr:LysR family transcriptional regulator [Azotobacter vinelandii]ACO79407.1 Transcriptional regulator LysR family protein [Azotobacter vinelandii DJ]AGK16388.1 Transcriptional regulator LysR family protein [Azotobacter vinelandii CA]AGK21200.1 Transcriptional regulator LysR family protein [Azotobacter vinelandii CA6]WKN20319.1 LysR family transcriptional regulator [Azotobacter vinelandii]SFY22224.1 DNA-binding transcriptional regulator, LysR family [Azotobacter vinelandii]